LELGEIGAGVGLVRLVLGLEDDQEDGDAREEDREPDEDPLELLALVDLLQLLVRSIGVLKDVGGLLVQHLSSLELGEIISHELPHSADR
jgi:hypothetical protein